MNNTLLIRHYGLRHYQQVWQDMQTFTAARDSSITDELWLVEHHPVFTQGQAGKAEHILDAGDIPIVQCDRGGQVTYHGPGQIVAYLLIDLKRLGLNIRPFVCTIENSVISLLSELGIKAQTRPKAPGIYVDDAKICSLGLRIRRGCSYHGLALNVAMDLSPFKRINPCGYQQLAMTQITDHIDTNNFQQLHTLLIKHISDKLGYTNTIISVPESSHYDISQSQAAR